MAQNHSSLTLTGCHFSDFSLISDFSKRRGTDIKLIRYDQNRDNMSIVPKDGLNSDKRFGNLSLNTTATHYISPHYLQTKFTLSE